MQIVSIEPWLVRIPLRQAYAIAYSTVSDTEIVYLEIKLSNGITGYGASNPFADVVGETPEQTLALLQSDAVQKQIGRNIEDYIAIIQTSYQDLPHYPGAQAALDIALHDAYAKCMKLPLVALFGQKVQPLPTSITIGIKSITETLSDAEAYYNQGFRSIKIKTGISIDEDAERIIKLYEKFGDTLSYRIDANLGYTLESFSELLKQIENVPYELIEQPLPVTETASLLTFDSALRRKFVADESLIDFESAGALVNNPQPFGVFNIKLMKAGGILAAKQIADLAARHNISVFWGCNDESLVSITAALHIAYACPNTKYLDLDGSLDVLETLFAGGFYLKNGYMMMKAEHGLGVNKLF